MSIINKLKQFATAFQKIRIGCNHYDVSLSRALAAFTNLYVFKKFSIKEIVGYALYAPKIRSEMPILISKERSLEKLARWNPREIQERTEDKAKFYDICRATNLPIPINYGLFRDGRGVDANQAPLNSKKDWVSYFEAKLPTHFIVKDISGVYGSGFAAFERVGRKFIEVNGPTVNAGELYDRLREGNHPDLVIQERLFNHPDLAACSGSGSLCTLRVNTLMNENGSVSILFYILKIPVGDNITDNFAMGTTGNLIAFGDSNEGILRGARTMPSSGSGLTTIYSHPDTGVTLDGYRIPMWKEAINMAKSTHESFSEFGSLGWDLALTENGPKILEANPWWDPPTYAPQIMSRQNWQLIFG